MAMLVGDESLQFRFVDSSLRPIQYHITYNQETKQLIAPATILQHMTLGIDTITSDRSKTEYKHWNIKGYTSPVLDQLSQQYYFYAKVPTGTGEGEFVLSPTAIGMDDVAGFYHLLVGLLNSEYDGERSFVTLYGFTEILPGRITTDKIVSADGTTYFDLANSVIGGRIKFRSTNGTEKDLSDFENEFNNQTADFIEAIGGLQSQIDGAIESFFYEYDPTTSNVPASSWKTDEDKNKHLNDTFTNLQSGRSWRWTKSGSTFNWTEITDTATTEALKKAGQAQDTADSKRRVFVSTPYTPYDIGDLWVQGTSGDIMRCKVQRLSGGYNAADWVKASKYTDDSKLNEFIGGDYADLKKNAVLKETIIEGGYLKNDLIDTNNLIVKNIYSKDGKFKTLEDGTIYGVDVNLEGTIKADDGTIGGFEIGQGRIGVAESGSMGGSYDGLSILSSFIKYSAQDLWTGFGTNVMPASSGMMGLCRLEYTGSRYTSGLGLYIKFRPRNYGNWWNPPKALNIDGNSYLKGGFCLFEDTYRGQAYTNIIEENIGVTHSYVFTSIGGSYVRVRLPTSSQIQSAAGTSQVTFLLHIQVGYLGNGNRISVQGQSGCYLCDNNANHPNGGYGSVDMAQGASLLLRYNNGDYYMVIYGT